MSLRCLVFSSNEEIVQPIWQVLTALGIEGEHCKSAVDAVERVTTQLFHIVITDWDDQPEAAFLLKTARDLKAAQRPLTLAIVGDDARLPEALKAGANSVLVKPIRAEQVRDTMSTACELLRAKQQPGAPQKPVAQPTAPAARPETPEEAVMAAAASAGAVAASTPTFAPPTVTQAPEKSFRAGEFLQSPSSAPGAQFDTETECEVQKSLDQAAAAELDSLTELEPTAAAVEEAPAEPAQPIEAPPPLTGWASLQARLTRSAAPPVEAAPEKSELLSYGETPSHGTAAKAPTNDGTGSAKEAPQPESGSEAALFAYMPGETSESSEPAAAPRSKRGGLILAAILAAACVVLVAVPRARQSVRAVFRSAARQGVSWLNPPPAPVPQGVPQHDSFGQSGDEYKLPVPANIPDATTDPSQIRVLPVVDPTAKPEKAGQAPATAGENSPSDQNQAAQNPSEQSPSEPSPSEQPPSEPGQSGQAPAGENPIKDPATTVVADVPANSGGTNGTVAPAVKAPNAVPSQAVTPQPRPLAPPVRKSAPPHDLSTLSSTGIPSSLKSQMASTTPEASGNKPPEAAMSSIEPVTLPEAAVRGLLAQPIDPVYPEAAKASGQRGSVVLQVLIGRDGAVQDAKFLQGSLVFARAAIDAVKQWHFKPYSMNGRAVSVQSVITLKFQPPA